MTSSSLLFRRNSSRSITQLGGAAAAVLLLMGCDENGEFSLSLPQAETSASTAGTTKSTKLVERDVEAPEVFSATDEGLWDGRPSLGGVWVAHPDVSDPERVIVRNQDNGKFVIGALFRKERDLPGPKLQISSDAAAALGILAGAPAKLNVTALIREEAEEPLEIEPEMVSEEDVSDGVEPPAEVSEAALDPIAAASAAIDAAPATPSAVSAASTAAVATPVPTVVPTVVPTPEPTAAAQPAVLAKPFIQIGIFSKENNAKRAARQMSSAGIIPTVKRGENNGKPFWRVVVGPSTSQSELDALTKSIKAEGFSDAYAVNN